MDRIRQDVNDLLAEEDDQLKVREAESTKIATSSKYLIIAGNLLALSLLTISGLVARVDRKKRDHARSELFVKSAELERVFNATPGGIITFDNELRIRMINPAATRIFKCGEDSAVGQPLKKIIPERMWETVIRMLHQFMESGEKIRYYKDELAMRFDGTEFPFEGMIQKSDVDSKPFYTLTIQDLSLRYSSAEKIQEQTEIFEQIREAIFVCDLNDRITTWNRAASLLFGVSREAAIGRDVVQLLYADQPQIWEAGKADLAEKRLYSSDVSIVNREGQELIVEQRRSVIRNRQKKAVAQLVICSDVTERKRQESNQRRAQRIESIGTLAGGIAHDLNNLLTPILMNAKLLKRGRGDNEKLTDNIILSAQRGSEMIAKLLSFAGGSQRANEQVEVAAIIGESHEILRHALPKSIELQVNYRTSLDPIAGDPTELSQVIMNLAINARDAMPEGGRLELRAENFTVDKRRATQSGKLQPGPHVLITVADEGTGIPKDIIEHIFDPFFTTKEQGKGTGLGLATSLGIIRQHGGDITVYSEVGKGSCFSILIPSTVLADSLSSFAADGEVPEGNGQTILLVDDEAAILEAARATLEASGYRVATATNGAEAVAKVQNNHDFVDVILLDMMMPGLDGVQTRDGIRAVNPVIPIIASSGLRRPGQEKKASNCRTSKHFCPNPTRTCNCYVRLPKYWRIGTTEQNVIVFQTY